MDPLAPSAASQTDTIALAFAQLTSNGSEWRTVLISGVLLVAVLLLAFATRPTRRMGARYAVHVTTGQQQARSLSKQESCDPTPADIRARAIGTLGEGLVTAEIEKAEWPMLRSIILDVDGRTTEIDHLVKLPDGIVALEVKTYSGFISGGAQDLHWTQHLPSGTHRLLNPVRQNLAHLRALRAFLGDQRVRLRGFVVAAGRARFAPEIAHIPVPLTDIRSVIAGEVESGMAEPAVSAAWSRLQAAASVSRQRSEGHTRLVQSRKTALEHSPPPAMLPPVPTTR